MRKTNLAQLVAATLANSLDDPTGMSLDQRRSRHSRPKQSREEAAQRIAAAERKRERRMAKHRKRNKQSEE